MKNQGYLASIACTATMFLFFLSCGGETTTTNTTIFYADCGYCQSNLLYCNNNKTACESQCLGSICSVGTTVVNSTTTLPDTSTSTLPLPTMLSTTTTNDYSWKLVGDLRFTQTGVGETSLKFHPATHEPYIAFIGGFTGAKVNVMRFNDATWVSVGNIDFSPGTADHTFLEFNPITNEPYVVFQDDVHSHGTTVMKYNGTSWEFIGDPGIENDQASEVTIAFHPITNELWIAHQDHYKYHGVVVRRFHDSTWETIGDTDFVNQQSNNPVINFHPITFEPYVAVEAFGAGIHTYYWNDATWVKLGTTVPPDYSGGNYMNFSMDPINGEPYIVYSNINNNWRVHVRKFDGSNWVQVGNAPISAGSTASPKSIAFHPISNQPYVAFRDSAYSSRATVMRFNGSIWELVGVAGFSDQGAQEMSLAFHPETHEPYISYSNGTWGGPATVMRYGP